MRTFSLNIADYIIRIIAPEQGPMPVPSGRFAAFICNHSNPDVTINVHTENFFPPAELKLVFNAPLDTAYYDSTNEAHFWSVFTCNNSIFIKVTSPVNKSEKGCWLRLSLSEKHWDLFIDTDNEVVDPLFYPLDGLILYYLTVIKGDIFIHASGVSFRGKGYIFTGSSGMGKSTIAGLWSNAGAEVIHDDRLILRNTPKGWYMYNTPVYENQKQSRSTVDAIYIIDHGIENSLYELKNATALTGILSNCIQQNWDHDIITRLTGALYELNSSIKTYSLYFRPDSSIIDYILANG